MEINPLEILQKTHMIKHNEHMNAAQAQQQSPVKDRQNLQNIKETERTKRTRFNLKNSDSIQRENYTTTLCVSKKEYESIVDKRPLIKFRPLVNSFIKSSDKLLLAESLGIPKNEVDRVINETTDYLLYKDPKSMYYDEEKVLNSLYLDSEFKRLMFEKNITDEDAIKKQEQMYYEERGSLIEPYIYRHGSKEQLLNYMKLQLSDAKSALKQLYNILDNECHGLYSYFERPIHVLDNHTILKMDKIIKDGLGNAQQKGYITQDMYTQNVEWALEKIYSIQSDTSLREALRTVAENR